MRIDSHQHFWRYQPQRDAWITAEMAVLRRDFLPEELGRELAANKMDACIAVQADQSEAETEFLLELAARHEQIAAVVGWVDLLAPNVARRVRHFSQFEKLRGFRHIVQAEPDDRFLLQPDFLRGIDALGHHGLTYDLLVYPQQLPAAIELAARFPQQPFVLDHLGKPPIKKAATCPGGPPWFAISRWHDHIYALAAHRNVFCKLSGLVTEADWRDWKPADFTLYL